MNRSSTRCCDFRAARRRSHGVRDIAHDSWRGLEALERRTLLSVTSMVDVGGNLTITSDAGDAIFVNVVGGDVLINGEDADTGPAAAAGITSILVQGGPGNNTIDLLHVSTAAFTSLTSVTIHGGDGNDQIIGSEFGDTITGGDGNDLILGGLGDDTIDGGDGRNTIRGGAGDDTISDGAGKSRITDESGDDAYTISGGDRVIDRSGNNSVAIADLPILGKLFSRVDLRTSGVNLITFLNSNPARVRADIQGGDGALTVEGDIGDRGVVEIVSNGTGLSFDVVLGNRNQVLLRANAPAATIDLDVLMGNHNKLSTRFQDADDVDADITAGDFNKIPFLRTALAAAGTKQQDLILALGSHNSVRADFAKGGDTTIDVTGNDDNAVRVYGSAGDHSVASQLGVEARILVVSARNDLGVNWSLDLETGDLATIRVDQLADGDTDTTIDTGDRSDVAVNAGTGTHGASVAADDRVRVIFTRARRTAPIFDEIDIQVGIESRILIVTQDQLNTLGVDLTLGEDTIAGINHRGDGNLTVNATGEADSGVGIIKGEGDFDYSFSGPMAVGLRSKGGDSSGIVDGARRSYFEWRGAGVDVFQGLNLVGAELHFFGGADDVTFQNATDLDVFAGAGDKTFDFADTLKATVRLGNGTNEVLLRDETRNVRVRAGTGDTTLNAVEVTGNGPNSFTTEGGTNLIGLGEGDWTVTGGRDDDTVLISQPMSMGVLHLGLGMDTVGWTGGYAAPGGVTFDNDNGFMFDAFDLDYRIKGIDTFIGTTLADVYISSPRGGDSFAGGGGNDQVAIRGDGGTYQGGAGDDTFNVNGHDAVIDGGADNDTAHDAGNATVSNVETVNP